MSETLFSSLRISAAGMAAQRVRMDVVAENIANAESTRTPEGGPYRRRLVVFKSVPEEERLVEVFGGTNRRAPLSVKVSAVTRDMGPLRKIHDPSHPDADENGMVSMPNVNVISEMLDLYSSSRSFEANVTVFEAAKRMYLKTLEILR